MKTLKSPSIVFIQGIVTALLVAAAPRAHAATIWNGPDISFSHSDENGLADQMTPGVAITRGTGGGGLYNAVAEGGATSGISPKDTEWAIGTLDDYANNLLTFGPCPLEAGNHPPGYVGTTFVVHLISDDIYLSLTLTDWGAPGGFGDKTFSYTRSTAAAAAPPTPTVTITNPPSGAVFAAPANVNIGADASVSSGTVTNVQFFTNGISVGSILTAPFSLTASNLTAGAYALTAVATAAGISVTSVVVNITVVLPLTVSITNPVSGAVFAAPANVNIGANATVSGGTVTNVQFFTNGISVGSILTAPFTLTASNLTSGAYALTAIATAAGISATSTVVNITVDTPPSVTITNPLNNATLSAPANVTILASASDSDGSVTNMQFIVGSNILTNVNNAPFSGTTNNLGAGSYILSAIASDNNGVKNTNVISITVVTPVVVSLGNPATSSSTNFQFSYSANVGLSYVIQRSTNLAAANWIPLATNTAASNPVVFMDVHATNSPNFYRVGRLPNP
jgi:uncharacterized protein (DUF2141 family)